MIEFHPLLREKVHYLVLSPLTPLSPLSPLSHISSRSWLPSLLSPLELPSIRDHKRPVSGKGITVRPCLRQDLILILLRQLFRRHRRGHAKQALRVRRRRRRRRSRRRRIWHTRAASAAAASVAVACGATKRVSAVAAHPPPRRTSSLPVSRALPPHRFDFLAGGAGDGDLVSGRVRPVSVALPPRRLALPAGGAGGGEFVIE